MSSLWAAPLVVLGECGTWNARGHGQVGHDTPVPIAVKMTMGIPRSEYKHEVHSFCMRSWFFRRMSKGMP